MQSVLELCQKRIGYRFKDQGLLKEALTHSSGADTHLTSNERMEFLGDAVFGFVICETLFMRFPELREGDMTKIKSAVVSRSTCQEVARLLGLEECLIVGRGIPKGGRIPSSMLSNVVESLIAAIYLDGGINAARERIRAWFEEQIVRFADTVEVDNYKSLLQQVAQRDMGHTPEYRIMEVCGPDHSKCFRIGVRIGSMTFQSAWGNNKKEAEQRAAENALYILRGEEAPYYGGE